MTWDDIGYPQGKLVMESSIDFGSEKINCFSPHMILLFIAATFSHVNPVSVTLCNMTVYQVFMALGNEM